MDSSKLVNFQVLTDSGEDASKLVNFQVLTDIGEDVSKLVNFQVLQDISVDTSKLVSYSVINRVGADLSKQVSYVVLAPPGRGQAAAAGLGQASGVSGVSGIIAAQAAAAGHGQASGTSTALGGVAGVWATAAGLGQASAISPGSRSAAAHATATGVGHAVGDRSILGVAATRAAAAGAGFANATGGIILVLPSPPPVRGGGAGPPPVQAIRVAEIPTRPGRPQHQTIALGDITYTLLLYWDTPAGVWMLDIADEIGVPIVSGLPLVTGLDLLEQYAYLGIGGALVTQSDFDWRIPPTFDNLGDQGHLYFIPTAATAAARRIPPPPEAPQLRTRAGVGISLPQPQPPPPTALCLPSVTFIPPPPPPPPEFNSEALAVSADGTVVVGASRLHGPTAPGGGPHAFRWTAATGMVDLGTLPGHTQSGASLISSDGSTIAGLSLTGGIIRGFRWTAATGMVDIGQLTSVPPATGPGNTFPMAISSDGSVIMGQSGQLMFRWTQATGIVNISPLGDIATGSRVLAGMSADGGIVVERFRSAIPGDGGFYGAVYTPAGGEVEIDLHYTGVFMGAGNNYQTDVCQLSANGSIAFGRTDRVTGFGGIQPAGTLQRWTGLPGSPVQTDLGTLDANTGLPVFSETLTGYTPFPFGISADGSVVAGELLSPLVSDGGGGYTGGVFVRAFVWTAATGIIDIGTLGTTSTGMVTQVNQALSLIPTYPLSSCVSADGTTVVGGSIDASNHGQAFRWSLSGGMVALPNLGGTVGGAGAHSANAVSPNGSVIVGKSFIPNNTNFHAFRWTLAGGIQDLGTL